MPLPFKSHPLYGLRNAMSMIALIGIILAFLSYIPYGSGSPNFLLFLLFVSAVFTRADVFLYALRKVEHPDEEPKWPNLKVMFGDFVLAVTLQIGFWATIAEIIQGYGYIYARSPAVIIEAYGALAALLCSLLHAYCFWKELMARYKQSWLTTVIGKACARCGYTEAIGPQEQRTRSTEGDHSKTASPPNTCPYAGSSAPTLYQQDRPTNVLTPQSTDSAMEEGLLIGSDFGGYGSVSASDPNLEEPAKVVVASGKGKKKATSGKKDGKKA